MSENCNWCGRRIWDGEADPTAEDCVSAAGFILSSAEDVISCESVRIARLQARVAELEAQLALNDQEFANVAARAYQHSQDDWEHLEEAARLLRAITNGESVEELDIDIWMENEEERIRNATKP